MKLWNMKQKNNGLMNRRIREFCIWQTIANQRLLTFTRLLCSSWCIFLHTLTIIKMKKDTFIEHKGGCCDL